MSKLELFRAVQAPEGLQDARDQALKPCFLCGGRRVSRLYMQAHFPVVRCLSCRLVYADEHFQREDLAAFYTGDYYERAYVCHPKEIDRKIANDYVRAFDRMDQKRNGGRLLDFGSARATFLHELRNRGYERRWTLEGIDINPDEVAMGRSNGLSIACGTLDSVAYPRASFDAVTAFSVIEHLQKPDVVLRQIAEVVRPGGELLIIVPHGECLIVKLAVLASKIFGERARRFTDNVFHEEHLYYFGVDSLSRTLRAAGFEPRDWFFEPSYLETHPPGPLIAVGAYTLRLASWMSKKQTMLGVVATRTGTS